MKFKKEDVEFILITVGIFLLMLFTYLILKNYEIKDYYKNPKYNSFINQYKDVNVYPNTDKHLINTHEARKVTMNIRKMKVKNK